MQWLTMRRSGLLALGFFLMMVAYFLYHLFSGSSGLVSLRQSLRAEERLDADIQVLKKRKKALEKRTNLLRGGRDPDLLEEQVRQKLGYIRKGEKIFWTQP